MRTLIDVSLFVHTRRAWHGKQYFKLATIVVAWYVFLSSLFPFSRLFLLSLLLLMLHRLGLSASFSLPPFFLSASVLAVSPSRFFLQRWSRASGPFAFPWNLRSVSHRQSRHARTDGPSYTSHVCSSSRRVAHVHVYHRLNWSWPVRAVARARLINVLQSRISGSRTRAIYTGLTTGLPWGKIISMFR